MRHTGAFPVGAVTFDVKGVAENVVSGALRRARNSETTVRLDGPAANAVGDPLMTRRILENLVDNALLHGGADVRVRITNDAGRTMIRIEDDGDGLPPQVRTRVFERFNRLPGGAEGFGLGLAIAHALAQAQNGSLRLEPDPVLTRFVLELPAPTTERSGAIAPPANAPRE